MYGRGGMPTSGRGGAHGGGGTGGWGHEQPHPGYGGGGGGSAYGDGYDDGHGGTPHHDPYGGGGGYEGGYERPPLVGSPGARPRDPQRAWDFTSLANSLQNMEVAVVQAEEALSTKGHRPGFEDGAGAHGDVSEAGSVMYDEVGNVVPRYGSVAGGGHPLVQFDEYGRPIPPPPQINFEELPPLAANGGDLYKKGGGRGGLFSTRSWTSFYMKLEELDPSGYEWGLAFYDKPAPAKAAYVFRLDSRSIVSGPPPGKVHKNRNVKNDFEITNGYNEHISLYCDTPEDGEDWMVTVEYVVEKLAEAEHYATNPDALDELAAASGHRDSLAGGSTAGSTFGGNPREERSSVAEKQALADDAQSHSAYGPGLYEATHGEQTYFIIQAHDGNGVPKNFGGDEFAAALVNDELHMDISAVDNGDGTYLCEYTPSRAGEYELRILYQDHHIYGSPFQLGVVRAPTTASHCLVSGEGTTLARPGVEGTFTIVARDQFDHERGVGGDKFEIAIMGAGQARPILDHGNGIYTVSYVVDTAHPAYASALSPPRGAIMQYPTLEVHISLNNEGFAYPRPVSGSPFHPRILVPEIESLISAQMTSHLASPTFGGYSAASSPLREKPALVASERYGGMAASPRGDDHVDLAIRERLDLAAKERTLSRSIAEVDEMRRKLEDDRASVDRQMLRMNELGRKVKEDSERLAEQAKILRAVASSSPSRTYTPTAAANTSHTSPHPRYGFAGTPGSPADSRVITAPGPIQAVEDSFTRSPSGQYGGRGGADGASVATGGGRGYGVIDGSVAGGASAITSPGPVHVGEAPRELFEPEVMSLFDHYKKPLLALWQFYSGASGGEGAGPTATPTGLDMKRFVELYCDFDIAPTFLTRRELKGIFIASARAHTRAHISDDEAANVQLDYAGFVEALGRTALLSLAKPAFQHLYPSAREKVLVLLEMWGMADPRKLQEMERRPRAKAVRK